MRKEKFHSGSKLKLIQNRILIDTWLKFLMTKVIWHFGYLIFYKVSSLFRQMRCAIWHLGVIFSIFYYYCLFWQFSFIEFTRFKTSNKWNSKLLSSFKYRIIILLYVDFDIILNDRKNVAYINILLNFYLWSFLF